MILQSNIIFDGHYTLIRQLGRGGFSEVWLAHDSYMDLDVAIKIYAPGQGLDSHSIDEFLREITRVFHLNHPNLLKPQHLGIYEQMPYLIMAYCPAGSCISRIAKMTEQEVWKLIHDVASGLAYLHEKDIVHQDIKPDNILIDVEGNYLITDFGISTHARSTLRKSVMCSTNSAGTLAYMGPERFSQQPAPTKASDIWSFGAMLFELLEGTTPFPPDFGGSMQNANAVIPTIKAPVSDKLKQTIYKMLSKETWDRPTASILVNGKNNQEPTSPPPTPKKPEEPKTQSYKYWIWVLIVVICGGIGIFIFTENKPTQQSVSYSTAEPSAIKTNTSNTKTSTTSSNSGATMRMESIETIDQNRVKRVISDISRYSSKGSDYAKLEYCFTDMISPHPSGEVRYRNTIASATQKFVEYYPMYEISEPYNFVFVNNSFPLKVECNVNVTWISKKNGKKIKASIQKTYYITSDYKVSGFIDKELNRTTLTY